MLVVLNQVERWDTVLVTYCYVTNILKLGGLKQQILFFMILEFSTLGWAQLGHPFGRLACSQ